MGKKFKDAKIKDETKKLQKKLYDYCNEPGHKVPTTRREFLTAGVIAAGTQLMAPSLLTLASRSAWAQELSCAESAVNFPTYINLQLAGGPALFANHLAHAEDGKPYSQYARLGVGAAPVIAKYFSNNAPFFGPDDIAGGGSGDTRPGSGFIKGLKQRMGEELFNTIIGGETAGTPGKTAFVAVACKSIDDRFTNKHDLSGMLINAGVGANEALPTSLVIRGKKYYCQCW